MSFGRTILPLPLQERQQHPPVLLLIWNEETACHIYLDRPGTHSTGAHYLHRIGWQLLYPRTDRRRDAYAHLPIGTDRAHDCRPTW